MRNEMFSSNSLTLPLNRACEQSVILHLQETVSIAEMRLDEMASYLIYLSDPFVSHSQLGKNPQGLELPLLIPIETSIVDDLPFILPSKACQ